MKATDETKLKAKEAGIKSWHVKSEERLQEELANLTEAIENVTEDSVGITIPEVEIVETKDEPEKKEDALGLPANVEKSVIIRSIKGLGAKSPYWKFRDLV